ncbi:MAG: His-Xaa-Ser system radical SAM maturase HxsC [Thermodesulfovibrionia bacterium]|nr:His-Xaa-Ser system radical SAM maturase HxsC [Thermodesulfovibrionia bacterium]
MRSFKTITNNNKMCICKITSKCVDANGTISYFASMSNGNTCIILEARAYTPENYTGFVYRIYDDNQALDVGDIVRFEETGHGTVIYENKSFSNAIFLTEKCNCRCIMCPQPPKSIDNFDHINLSRNTLSLLDSETEVIGITGGEPTMVWEDLMEVLTICRTKLPKTSIQLLTNARVLKDFGKTQELSIAGGKNLIVCIPVYADVYSIHDKIVSVKGAFWETINGIYNLERLNIKIELRTVISKLNYSRLTNWSEFIYRNLPFVSHIALMGLEPTGLALKNIDEVWIDPLEYMPMLEEATKLLYQRNMNVSIYNHQLCTLPKKLWGFSKKSISEWKNIYLIECIACNKKNECGGFFKSSEKIRGRNISPFI